jgi:gluconokinase
VRFVHLLAPPELIAARVTARRNHYMPPSLLDSQLAALEPLGPDEPGIGVDTTGDAAAVAERALQQLGGDTSEEAADDRSR